MNKRKETSRGKVMEECGGGGEVGEGRRMRIKQRNVEEEGETKK